MYESFYLRAVAPDRPLGVWIRYTVHKRHCPGGTPPRGSVWCTVFDGTRRPLQHKLTTDELSVPPGGWIAVGDSLFGPGRAEGTCGEARWALRFASREPELRHLPQRLPVPRPAAPHEAHEPRARGALRGRARAARRARPPLDSHPTLLRPTVALPALAYRRARRAGAGWSATTGAPSTPSAGSGCTASASPRTPPRGSTWRSGGCAWRGAPPRGWPTARSTSTGPATGWAASGARGLLVAERPERCVLSLPGAGGLVVEAHVHAPREALAGWRYADPDGAGHDVSNCSIAALTLTVRQPGRPARTLRTAYGAAYELGMRERDHGVPIAPFPDG